jgi:uncharacterized protein YcbK (DUF882 family)
MNYNRRQFISKTAQAAICCLFPTTLFAANTPDRDNARSLSFYNLHTDERLNICYFMCGRYQTQALNKIDFILRDHRSGEIKPIDRALLDLLFDLSRQIDPGSCFHVISGYRSPTTNARLRKRSRGVASGSLHMEGRAIDIRVPGYNTSRLRQICQNLKAGGVGYYPKSDFVHVDTGRVRSWGG